MNRRERERQGGRGRWGHLFWLMALAGMAFAGDEATGTTGDSVVLFLSNQGKPHSLYSARLEDGGVTRWTDPVHSDLDPRWSPDREQIAFVSRRDGNGDIIRMEAGGGNQQRVTHSGSSADNGGAAELFRSPIESVEPLLGAGVVPGATVLVSQPVSPVHASDGASGVAYVYLARIAGGPGGRHTDGHTVRMDAEGRLEVAHYRTDGALPELRLARLSPDRFEALARYLTGEHALARSEANGPITDYRPTRVYLAYRNPAGERFVGSAEPEALPETISSIKTALEALASETALTRAPAGDRLQFLPAPKGARRSPQVIVSEEELHKHSELQDAVSQPGRFVLLTSCATEALTALGIEPGRAYRVGLADQTGLIQIFRQH